MIKIVNKEITTKRLKLRHFLKEDIETYAEIMGNNEIAKWFPKGVGYSHKEAKKSLDNILSHWKKYGFGLWAITKKENPVLIGRCGLNYILETSEVEIDFVLMSRYWKKGYATEAAKASLHYGFKILSEIIF
jgi:ribosomal-protein-alanine N-acetyltransferase